MGGYVDNIDDDKNPQTPASDPISDLGQLRDQLGDYLSTIERNTDAVNTWLSANQNNIILFHQKLARALRAKNETQALALVKDMGDVAGFVLSLNNARETSEAAFGTESAFLKEIATIPWPFPTHLQEPLPAISVPDAVAAFDNLPTLATLSAQTQSSKWWPGTWFNRDEKRAEDEQRELYRKLRLLKSEILGLQSNRHYYIDSYMDWIGDLLSQEREPDAQGNAADDKTKMLQFMNPAFVIRTAQSDYEEAVKGKAAALRDAALSYTRIADAIDSQDVHAISQALRNIYPAAPTATSLQLKKILLDDYQAASLDELILKHVEDRASQAKLLSERFPDNVQDSERLRFSNAVNAADIFGMFADLVLDKKKDPLPSNVLPRIMRELKSLFDASPDSFAFSATKKESIFLRIADRFADDITARQTVMAHLLTGMEAARPTALAVAYTIFDQALRDKNVIDLSKAMNFIQKEELALETLSLWYLCHPHDYVVASLLDVTSDTLIKASLLDHALNAGLLDEIRNRDYAPASGKPSASLIADHVLPALAAFPVDTLRRLIAHSFSTGGLDGFRARLSQAPDLWLEKIITADIVDDKKLQLVAALLEPFTSDIVKANILATAAENTPSSDAAAILSDLDNQLIGRHIPLAGNHVLCNLDRIANLWYKDGSLLYVTDKGLTNVALSGVSDEEAGEIITLIKRRGNFLQETLLQGNPGLFQPALIDVFQHDSDHSEMWWGMYRSPLNADEETVAALKKQFGFVHVRDPETGDVKSYNVNVIALLQELEDGSTLLIDKYGAYDTLTGDINIESSQLLALNDGALFNPANASIMLLDKNSLKFRIESDSFDKLLNQQELDTYYDVSFTDTETRARLERTLLRTRGIARASDKSTAAPFYFNMSVLGYLEWDEHESGFYCSKSGVTNRAGMINMDDSAQEFIANIAKAEGMIHVGDLLVHEDNVDDAYYSAENEEISFVIGGDSHAGPAPSSPHQPLAQLAKNAHFTIVNDNGPKEPVDVLQFDRVTLLMNNGTSPAAITDSPQIPLALSAQEFKTLCQNILEKDMEDASDDWTKRLAQTLERFPALDICVAPFVSLDSPQVLVQQVLGQSSKPQLQKAFRTVAQLPDSYQKLHYPETDGAIRVVARQKKASRLKP